jgi:uncharacterized protein YeaO (DUF488 family)
MTSTIQLKRAYEPAQPSDGMRILVERLWPHGLSKEKAHIDLWLKEIAPSTELRKWYNHQLERWPEFQQKYAEELKANPEQVSQLKKHCSGKKVTFIYAAHDEAHNSAVVLKQFLEGKH